MAKKVYYKATRADGTDFKTGKVKYDVGKVVVPETYAGHARICGPGFVHASDVPTETLIIGQWPCRLFEVEGEPMVGFDSQNLHKGGFKELRVLRELDARLVFGPQGGQIVKMINYLTRQDVSSIRALGSLRGKSSISIDSLARTANRSAARAAMIRSFDKYPSAVAKSAGDAYMFQDLIPAEDFKSLVSAWQDKVGEILDGPRFFRWKVAA